MTYTAYVNVTDSDDDFLFFVGGSPCYSIRSRGYTGATKVEALLELLTHMEVGHPSYSSPSEVPAHGGYRHVDFIRQQLLNMAKSCRAGNLPGDGDLHWHGNWEVDFVIVKDDNEAPTNWDDNHKQFARLLDEIVAAGGLTPKQYAAVEESADMGAELVNEIFCRATIEFQRVKLGHDVRKVTPQEEIDLFQQGSP